MGHRRQRRVAPTHHELILLKKELTIARKGEHVLERRRDGLVVILLDLLDRFQALHAQLETEFAAAVHLHQLGAEREGEIALRELAKARSTPPELIISETELRGLEIPFILSDHISTSVEERGYGLLGTTALDDEIVRAYEQVLEEVVRLAEMRAVVVHLLGEIHRLRIRVNYLTHRLIPELEAEQRYVEMYLEEREREERYRQLWMKRHRDEDSD